MLPFTNTTGLVAGQYVTGSTVPVGTYILSVQAGVSVTLSQNTTAAVASGTNITFSGETATTTVTAVTGLINTNYIPLTSAAGLIVGETVATSGATTNNLPTNTVITAISGNTIYINNNLAAAIASGTNLYFGSVGVAGSVGESFTGNVTVGGGTLQMLPTANSGNGSVLLGAPAASNTVNNLIFGTDTAFGNGYAGGTFLLQGSTAAGTLTQNAGQLNLSAGAGTISITNGNVNGVAGSGVTTLNFQGSTPIVRSAGAVVNFAPGAGTGGITFTTPPTLSGAASSAIIGTTATNAGFAYFTSNGSNTNGSGATAGLVDFATYAVNGTNGATYTGVGAVGGPGTGTSYTSGLVASGSTANLTYLMTGQTLATTAPETINALKLTGASSLTLGGVLTIGTAGSAAGVLFDNSTGAASINAGASSAYTLGGAGSEIIVTVAGNTPANALTISAPISSGAGALTKAGSGKLIISGPNYFTGNVTVDEGTLQLSGATASLGTISTAGNVTTLRQGTTLDLNGAGPGATTIIGVTPAGLPMTSIHGSSQRIDW